MEATSSLEDKFVERVKSRGAHFGSDSSGLDGHQLKTIQSCFEIFAESALDSLSQAQQYRILRVRKLFRKVYSTLGPVMVVLCMLADSVTNIAKLNLEILIPKLWDQIYVPKKGLKDAATALCQEHQAVLESSDTSLRKRKRNQNSLHRDVVGKASLPTTAQQVREEGSEADNTGNRKSKTPVMLIADDVPGLKVSLLQNQLPQSVFDLDIKQLIGFIQCYHSTASNPQQLSNILRLLQHYQAGCPNLRYIQLIFPWYGALPHIDINIDSKIGWSAKVQFSCSLAVELVQYIRASWATTETSDGGIA